MISLNYSCKNNLHFSNTSDFFIIVGVLANNKYTKIVWEPNKKQGAWGNEARIHIYVDNIYITQILQSWFTKGRQNISPPILRRVQCNNYIKYLNKSFGIQNGIDQNGVNIRQIVQTQYSTYLNDFDIGYNS